MPIVEPIDEDQRKKEQRVNLARKALWLREISARTDGGGNISAEAATEAAVAAGVQEPPPTTGTEAEIEIARLRAGVKHGLNQAQVEAMTATTPEQIAEQAAYLAGGDGGPRGAPVGPGDPLAEQIREAEQAGDFGRSMSLKSQKLLDHSSAEAQRIHPNAPRK